MIAAITVALARLAVAGLAAREPEWGCMRLRLKLGQVGASELVVNRGRLRSDSCVWGERTGQGPMMLTPPFTR